MALLLDRGQGTSTASLFLYIYWMYSKKTIFRILVIAQNISGNWDGCCFCLEYGMSPDTWVDSCLGSHGIYYIRSVKQDHLTINIFTSDCMCVCKRGEWKNYNLCKTKKPKLNCSGLWFSQISTQDWKMPMMGMTLCEWSHPRVGVNCSYACELLRAQDTALHFYSSLSCTFIHWITGDTLKPSATLSIEIVVNKLWYPA